MEISEYSRRKYNLLKLRVEKRFIRGICKTIKKKWLIFWRKVDLKIAHIAWKSLTKKIPVVKNQIMFRTYQDNYTCNPKYLCEELLRQNADCKIIWVYSKNFLEATARKSLRELSRSLIKLFPLRRNLGVFPMSS